MACRVTPMDSVANLDFSSSHNVTFTFKRKKNSLAPYMPTLRLPVAPHDNSGDPTGLRGGTGGLQKRKKNKKTVRTCQTGLLYNETKNLVFHPPNNRVRHGEVLRADNSNALLYQRDVLVSE